jgi:hypothetical protein
MIRLGYGETTMGTLLFPLGLAFVGFVIGLMSCITKYRRWPGLIAGFDPATCADVDGLTRWVGGAGLIIGAACMITAAATYVAPQYRGAVGLVLALVIVAGTIVTSTGCARFTRR